MSTPELYGGVALAGLASLGSLFVLDVLLAVSSVALVTVYAAIALTAYYWFTLPAQPRPSQTPRRHGSSGRRI